MCGIAGLSLFEGACGLNDWSTIVQGTLSRRGPDDSGVFEDLEQRVALFHARLSILDLSPLGHQPMLANDGRVALVFNGELYNFRELRSEFEAEGHVFRGDSDTEVLLELYLNLREKTARKPDADSIAAMLQRLNGIFAFALWDGDCQALLLARDALGVKPLYM